MLRIRRLANEAMDPACQSTKNVKKELRKHSNDNWTARLQALNAQDNSLWAVQIFLKNKRSDIPPLNCSTGTAVTDNQKANILAESILINFTENTQPNNDYDDDDELINNTVNSFISLPPPTTTDTAYPSEIISYIKNPKKHRVRVKDTLSTPKFINCGVAQGNLLGPLLFNLYINDIPEYTLTKLNMFADDIAVHTTFKRLTSVTYALNKHLKILEKYYDRWKISINVEKSAAVLFTKKLKIPPPPTMYNTTIPWSQ
ncbi:RNA-directed DNA polymerase from mobile element jockey, partial [Trichonephila clavipes]